MADWVALPAALLRHAMSFAVPADWLRVSRVCRKWSNPAADKSWRLSFLQEFDQEDNDLSELKALSAKGRYARRHALEGSIQEGKTRLSTVLLPVSAKVLDLAQLDVCEGELSVFTRSLQRPQEFCVFCVRTGQLQLSLTLEGGRMAVPSVFRSGDGCRGVAMPFAEPAGDSGSDDDNGIQAATSVQLLDHSASSVRAVCKLSHRDQGRVTVVRVSAARDLVACQPASGRRLPLFRLSTGEPVGTVLFAAASLLAGVSLRHGIAVTQSLGEGRLDVYDIDTGAILRSLDNGIKVLAFSGDLSREPCVLLQQWSGESCLYSLASAKLLKKFWSLTSTTTTTMFAVSDRWVVSCGQMKPRSLLLAGVRCNCVREVSLSTLAIEQVHGLFLLRGRRVLLACALATSKVTLVHLEFQDV